MHQLYSYDIYSTIHYYNYYSNLILSIICLVCSINLSSLFNLNQHIQYFFFSAIVMPQFIKFIPLLLLPLSSAYSLSKKEQTVGHIQ